MVEEAPPAPGGPQPRQLSPPWTLGSLRAEGACAGPKPVLSSE